MFRLVSVFTDEPNEMYNTLFTAEMMLAWGSDYANLPFEYSDNEL